MQVRLRDPITRFGKIQEQLTQLLISEPTLQRTFAGYGISEDPRDRKNRIVALCQRPVDPELFLRLLSSTEELGTRRFDVPDFTLIETGEIHGTSRPASGGDGIQLRGGPSGTLGCLVTDQQNNELLLSCNHVIADCNNASLGDPIDEPPRSGHRLGELYDYEPLLFGGVSANTMDAALGKVDIPGDVRAGFRSGSAFSNPPDLHPALNSTVEKEGASTGRTTGVFTIKNLSVLVNFKAGPALFDKQYAIFGAPSGIWGSLAQPKFAAGGDSGSVVVLNSRVIGLLFAVSSRADMAFVTPIDSILQRFGGSLV